MALMFLILFRNILCPQQMFPSLCNMDPKHNIHFVFRGFARPRNFTSNNVSSFVRAFILGAKITMPFIQLFIRLIWFSCSSRHKEAKLREFYEKVFPEIKKQREQTERFTRWVSFCQVEVFKTDSVQSSSNYLQKLFTKNLLTAR